MAGIYGWNITATQDLLTNEGEFSNTAEPTQSENEDDRNDDRNDDDDDDDDDDDGDDDNDDNDDDNENEISSDNSEPSAPSIMGYYWCVSNGEIPREAVKSGIDKDGGDLYIGRAIHEGELLPAKIVPNHGCAYIGFDGGEIMKLEYEILCRGTCTVIWQACRDGAVPDNAVIGGFTVDNEKLYIGRVFYCGTQTPGKVHPSQNACFVPYGGEELTFDNYEVLILQ